MKGERARLLCWVIVVFALAASSVPTRASTMIPVGFEELAREAEFVIVGRVKQQVARFNDSGTMILTYTTVAVDEALAGTPPATVEIAEYGGRVGDRTMVSPGQVTYKDGERVVVFACRDALDLLRTCGAHQGRMRLQSAADGSLRAEGLMAGEAVAESLEGLKARIQAVRGGAR